MGSTQTRLVTRPPCALQELAAARFDFLLTLFFLSTSPSHPTLAQSLSSVFLCLSISLSTVHLGALCLCDSQPDHSRYCYLLSLSSRLAVEKLCNDRWRHNLGLDTSVLSARPILPSNPRCPDATRQQPSVWGLPRASSSFLFTYEHRRLDHVLLAKMTVYLL